MKDISQSNTKTTTIAFRPETVRAVFETVRDEYFGQERRHSLLISKTQTLATVATLFFTVTAASGGLTSVRGVYRIISSVGYGLAVIGVAICIYLLRSKEFHKVRYAPALDESELRKEPEIVMVNLAKTYDEAFTKSEGSYNALVRLFDRATLVLLVSVILGGVAVLSASMGNQFMNNEKPKPQIQSPTTPTPSMPQTGSYGTEVMKKSDEPPKTKSYGTQKVRENDNKKKQ